MNRLASHPLATSTENFLAAIRTQISVSTIATARDDLRCKRKDRWSEIENDMKLAAFDHIPLTDTDEKFVQAVFVRGTGPVDLNEQMLMASEAPLISFVESADRHTFRLLVKDSDISGMVTLSDIQKLPAYSVLFSLVIAVEMLLIDWIRKNSGPNDNVWLAHLNKKERDFIEKNWKKATAKKFEIDRLSHTTFGQEIKAARGLGLFTDQDERQAHFDALRKLRNQVFHAVEFASTPEEALKIPGLVREAQTLIAWLQGQIGNLSYGP